MSRTLLFSALIFLAWPAEPRAQATAVRAVVVSPTTSRSASEVAKQISECAEDMTCPLLADFRLKHESAFAWLRAWCQARTAQLPAPKRETPEMHVCAAAMAEQDVEAATKKVSVFELVEVAPVIAKPSCSGFGLVVPLYSVRHAGKETVASGPVKAGLGGGYYWGLVCKRSFSFGPEVFGYSEGLDPSGLLHFGVGGGLQMAAFTYFQFGLALGYDLYRRDTGVPPNGLLSGQGLGKASVSWLITFSIVPQQSEK